MGRFDVLHVALPAMAQKTCWKPWYRGAGQAVRMQGMSQQVPTLGGTDVGPPSTLPRELRGPNLR
eukprot:5223353-Alexandrium_andersonii.AAC.1